jgi:hypothetical protein
MENPSIVRDISSLPPEAQKQIIDFIAFLRTRYRTVRCATKAKRIKLAHEPFIGMWRDRDDMQDSAAWVRDLRHREWQRAK